MVNRKNNINMFRKSRLSGKSTGYAFLNLQKKIEEQPKFEIYRSPVRKTAERPVQKERPKRRLALALSLIFLLVFSSILGIVISISSKFALLEILLTMMSAPNFTGETNILVVGLDNVRGSHRTDAIMVIHVNPSAKKVSVVSIPRDTIVTVPGLGLTKINHAFTSGGTALTKRTLEQFLNVDIPFTVSINMGGLANIIDSLGGIMIDVEKRMYYVDEAGGLYIDLYPGRQVLDGKKAIGYVRFRHDAQGDFGRISRQQKFVRSLANRIITHKDVLKTPRLIIGLLGNIDTNLNSRQILGISMSMRQALDMGNIEMATIPGSSVTINKVYYLKPNIYETRRIISKMLRIDSSTGYVKSAGKALLAGGNL